MSTTMTRRNGSASPDSANRAARQATMVAQTKDPVRPRWGRIGGWVLDAVVGGWLFASLYHSGALDYILSYFNDAAALPAYGSVEDEEVTRSIRVD